MNRATTDIKLPSWVSCFRREGYGFDHVDPVRRTAMNSGRVFSREEYDFVPSFVPVKLRLRSIYGAAFEAWFRDVINNGDSWFKATMRTTRSDHDELTVRFSAIYSGPSLMNNGEFWDYEARLEVFERPLWPDGYGHYPEIIIGAECFDLMMNYYAPLAEADNVD